MAKVVLRREAINDLDNIWNYTYYKWSEHQAERYYESIKLACKEIGESPKIGKEYTEISKGIFGFRISKHIIFYQILSEKEVEIIRILHELMDLKNRISE